MLRHKQTVVVNTLAPFARLPRVTLVGLATIDSTDYFLAGKNREDTGVIFQYTLSGRGAFDDGRRVRSLPQRHAFLVRASNPACTYYYPADAREPWKVLWCSLRGADVRELADEIGGRLGYVFELPEGQGILRELEKLARRRQASVNLSASKSAALVHRLLDALMSSKEQARGPSAEQQLVERAMAWLGRDRSVLPSATQLAAAIGVSREHLSRAFRRAMDVSPYDFILNDKIERARVMLQDQSRPIKLISRDLGFSSPVQFATVFRHRTGRSPRAYRTALRA